MSGDQIAIVIEGVENVDLDRNSEYYVRCGLGQLKVGTQWTTIENRSLHYNAHTTMPVECMDDPVLSLELINTNDQVVAVRRVLEWRKRMQDLMKGILKVGLYAPNVVLDNDLSPTVQEDGDSTRPSIRPIGVARVRVYLNPRYHQLQDQYNRLDVYIGRLTDVIVKELLANPPHVLVSLGSTSGAALPGAAKPIDRDDGWEWQETFSFAYQSEPELVISVRDPVSDKEIGRATLFLSQVAYNLNKAQSNLDHTNPGSEVHKVAGSIPICDDYGAHVGLLVLGAELWHHATVHAKLVNKVREFLPALERRLNFDESLLKALGKDAEDVENFAAEQAMWAQQQTNDGDSPMAAPSPIRSKPHTEYLLAQKRISEIRNSVEKLTVEHNLPHKELITRRELRQIRERELNDSHAIQHELRGVESHLFQIACDIAQALNKQIVLNCENARSVARRCKLDIASSPRHGPRPMDPSEMDARILEAETLENRGSRLKGEVYAPEKLNDILPAISNMTTCVDESKNLYKAMVVINEDIRMKNEEARRAIRIEHARAHETKYDNVPPVVVQRTGLNCFACCNPPTDYSGEPEIIGLTDIVDLTTDPAVA